jgi:thiamine pyrophosphate-dependent acetolactate synthase large subunit-like protein
MAQTAADILVEVLKDWGREYDLRPPRRRHQRHHGIAAETPRCDPLRAAPTRGIRRVHGVRLRQGHRAPRGVSGCLGPGGLHLLNGLYDARLDGQPVLAITGLPYHDLIGTRKKQDVELDKVFADVAEYSVRIMGPTHVENVAERWALVEERGSRPDVPMKPQVVAWELGNRLHQDAIVCADSGTVATWWARQLRVKKGQMYSLSGTLASMANGLPYAMAAQIAYPERQVVLFVGDGGFSMLMAEFANCVLYKLPIKIVIVKNNSLGMIKW